MDGVASNHVLLRPGVGRVLEALGKSHRRLILIELRNEWVNHVDDVVMRGRGSDPTRSEQELRQIHLPKLADRGYIEWDPDTGEISRGPRYDEIEPLLDLIERHGDELPPDWP